MLRRRLVWLLVLLVAVAAGAAGRRRRQAVATVPAAAPSWPPLDPPPTTPPGPADAPVVPEPVDADPDPTAASWRAPVAGGCPPGYPVKAKMSSGIYHVPGGRFYERTTPDRCYADPASAEADGYRASKS